MEKPTKSEIDDFLVDTDDNGFTEFAYRDFGRGLAWAYLKQMEELKEWERKCKELCQAHGIALIQLHDLKVENQALKARLLELEV